MPNKSIESILLVQDDDKRQSVFAIALQKLCGFHVITVHLDRCITNDALERPPEAVVLDSDVCGAYNRLVSNLEEYSFLESIPVILVAEEKDLASSTTAPFLGKICRSSNYVEMALEVRELLRTDSN